MVNIPPQCICRSWEEFDLKPESFEVQVRTIFMHAWAEPQHDLLYKGEDTLTEDQKRSLYWVAASAWGCDKVYNEINEGKNKK